MSTEFYMQKNSEIKTTHKISKYLTAYTTFATSEERRIDFLIGRTEFVTSEKSRIDFSRLRRPESTRQQQQQQSVICLIVRLTFNLKWLHDS